MSKCKYYRESEIETYSPECCKGDFDIHPIDIEGDFCQMCGRKIKFKEFKAPPWGFYDE